MSPVHSILMWFMARHPLTGMCMSMVLMPMHSRHSPILYGGIGVSRRQATTTVGIRLTTIPTIRVGIMTITIGITRIITMPTIMHARSTATITGLAAVMVHG